VNNKSKILNKWILGAALSVTTLFSNASVLTNYDTLITGADMTGLKVTLTTSAGSEVLNWAMIYDGLLTLSDLGPTTIDPATGNPYTEAQKNIMASNGLTGGVSGSINSPLSGSNWSLTQQGFTGGDVSGKNYYGLWTFIYTGSDALESLVLDTLGTDLVFDTQLVSTFSPNNSDSGRGFTAFNSTFDNYATGVSATYSDQVANDELYGKVEIDFEQKFHVLNFWLDVDKAVEVPEPSMLLLFISGLALVVRRKYKAK
jgi:hypothetical protein